MVIGAVIADRFQIDALAGAGGMASVYRAWDRVTGESIALKLLRGAGEQASMRFAREARLLSELHHPAIVRYVSHGRADDGQLYLAMEWLEGEGLDQRLR